MIVQSESGQSESGQSRSGDEPTEPVTERESARRRLEARRDWTSHLVAYLVINSLLVTVWGVTGAGYFWPIWVIAPWGAGLVLHAWDVFIRKPVSEADVDAELRRRRG